MEEKLLTTITTNPLEFISNDDEQLEAMAALGYNPTTLTWAKFILTDDQPNANKQRVPLERFEDLIKSGIYMPIKMALGSIADGHDNALPIGTITNLKRVNNQIHGLAALWKRERPEDVEMIKGRYKEGKPLELSWELLYTNSSITDEIEDILDPIMKAVTLVGMPAYEGRTPIIAVAATNTVEENPNMEELEQLKLDLEALKVKYAELETQHASASNELEDLRKFKSDIEASKEKETKLASLKSKFAESGIQKDDEYFVTNEEMLLSLSEDAFNFMLQEMVTNLPKADASKKHKEIPNITEPSVKPTKEQLVDFLKNRKHS